MTVNIELDFRSEYLFRTRSVVTNLTSLEIDRIRYATMLCHFGQTRNCSVAFHFILYCSAATSSATGDYVPVPERFGQNEESAGRKKERTSRKPSFVPEVWLTDAVKSHVTFRHVNMIFLLIFHLILLKLSY